MGSRHSRDQIVAAAAEVALERGVGALTFRLVAERLGISDRMVVYYLPSKTELIEAAVGALSVSLQALLADAFGDRPRRSDDLVAAAWPVFTRADADRVAAIFLEVVGLASAGVEPFGQLARTLLDGWVTWLSDRVEADTPAQRRAGALGVIARVDGLLVIRHALGAREAEAAAGALGVSAPARPSARRAPGT